MLKKAIVAKRSQVGSSIDQQASPKDNNIAKITNKRSDKTFKARRMIAMASMLIP